MSEPVMEARGIVKFLGEGAGKVQALKGVDVTLHSGEMALLMGPSGSGKTTLLSILGCILSPSEGVIKVRGNPATGLKPEQLAKLRREHIGFVFQSYHLFPTLTALDNVRLALDVRGEHSPKTISRCKDALARVGLGHRIAAYPRELSGGEQQRVAIARALVGDAAAILADEPTAALDSENGAAIMAMLAELAKDPAHGVLVVTHDPRTLPYASRIIRIEDGRIVGEEAGVLAAPAPIEEARSVAAQ
jgi:putative ABC transport system ATP-binding protein